LNRNGLFGFIYDTKRYSGFISRIPDLYKAGRGWWDFYRGWLQAICEYPFCWRAKNSAWNIWTGRGSAKENPVADHT